MSGPGRRKVFDHLTRFALRLLGGKIRRGPAKGLRFYGGDTAGYVLGASEPAVQQALVDHLPAGGVFYDVGANIGFLTVLACRLVGPGGEVHCFEPVEQTLEQLRRNLDANGFVASIHEIALSDREGETAMVADGPLGRARLGEGRLRVRTARLDDLDLPQPTVIKIDVEGAESLVLRGMPELMRRHKPILIIEIHAEQDQPVRELLDAAGYTVRAINDDGMPHLLAR